MLVFDMDVIDKENLMQTETPEIKLPFVLLWAESLPSESRSRTDLVFSPSVGGFIWRVKSAYMTHQMQKLTRFFRMASSR